jgi:hypothetical protein
MNPKILPVVLMIIDIAAGAVYLSKGDCPRFVYWIAAATITGSTLFIK